ncbi:MAG: PQQ-dependent dehydrogenase, methanol/ethanol family [Pseudomonadota bacterium]|nr:PQQ-dependent dehydrogenase, methanol/ethanol family [Pseudomonadota bacterium]
MKLFTQYTLLKLSYAAALLLATTSLHPTPVDAAEAGNVNDQRIIDAQRNEPGSWLTYGQTYKEQRFSELTQINRSNIAELNLAWSKPIGDYNMRMQGTPLVVDGVMYVSNGWSVIYALNATNGEEIWRHDPEVDRSYAALACCGPAHNRGVAVYDGKVFVGTFDGRLIAVDANTGEELWDIDTWIPEGLGRFNITGAPRAAAGKVVIGQGSGESGHRRGYVTAYDTDTGEVAWRFFLVPGNPNEPFEHPEMELAAQTWGGEWWKYGGGGTAWNSLVYDEEFNSLYVGVGNGAPWPREIRSPGGGDDLFLSTIISLNMDTGRMNWYYQTTPGDNWDYSSAMDMTIGEIEFSGEMRQVLLQAPKNGFFYVLDRNNGELLRALPYTDGIDWATHVDMETGRPVENPDVVYEVEPQWIMPANSGAHNWEPQSWDNEQGLMYFYYHDIANFYSLDEGFVETGSYEIRERGLSLGWGEGEYRRRLIEQAGPRPDSQAYIGAFDPITGTYKWRHPLESDYNGGVVATRGNILFHPEGTGEFSARDTSNGELLWRFKAPGSFRSTSVITYQINGTQYVTTMMNGNRAIDMGGTVLTFKLNGDAELQIPEIAVAELPDLPDTDFTLEQVREGDTLYHAQCSSCHGGIGIADEVAIVAPDLRLMSLDSHSQMETIVLQGSRVQQGMPDFENTINKDELESIRAFVVTQARQLQQFQERQ